MQKLCHHTSILFLSCENQNDFIQDVYVNETIPLNLPEYRDLTPGNSIFVDGGVEGIIIYHVRWKFNRG